MCTQSHSHSNSKRVTVWNVNGTVEPQHVCEIMKNGNYKEEADLPYWNSSAQNNVRKFLNVFLGYFFFWWYWLSFAQTFSSYRKMRGINLASGRLHSWLFKRGIPLFRGGSEINKVLSLQDLWSFFFFFCWCFWTQKYKIFFPLSGNLIKYLTAYEMNNWKKVKSLFWFCMFTIMFSVYYWCFPPSSSYAKVQIVLGSQLILQMHPLDASVRTSLYYCQNIRKTVWDKCVFSCRKFDTFYSYMNVFNKL